MIKIRKMLYDNELLNKVYFDFLDCDNLTPLSDDKVRDFIFSNKIEIAIKYNLTENQIDKIMYKHKFLFDKNSNFNYGIA